MIVSRAEGSDKDVEWTPKDMNARTLVHEYGGDNHFAACSIQYCNLVLQL